jgi:hypothetical protein
MPRRFSKRFWTIKSAVFAVLLPALLICGVLIVFDPGTSGRGRTHEISVWLRVGGWLVATPLPPSGGLAGVFIAVGVNALLWAYVLSFAASGLVSGAIALARRSRAPAP